MDRDGRKCDLGNRLGSHGGVDNQQTLAFGTPEDVGAAIAENPRLLGAGGGEISAPCHSIQSIRPPENVVARYRAGLGPG